MRAVESGPGRPVQEVQQRGSLPSISMPALPARRLKLFLKGERCYTDKCAIERRNYPPGQHGQGRVKFSEYSLQLREKQKLKRMYRLLEGSSGTCSTRRTAARASPAKA